MKSLITALALSSSIAYGATVEQEMFNSQQECMLNTYVYVEQINREFDSKIDRFYGSPFVRKADKEFAAWIGDVGNATVLLECFDGLRSVRVFGVK